MARKKIAKKNYQQYINGVKYVVSAQSLEDANNQFKKIRKELQS